MFLVIWRFGLRLEFFVKLAVFCALILPMFQNHILRIISYFGFWCAGLWIARVYGREDFKPDFSFGWQCLAIFAVAAFGQINLPHILLTKTGVDSFGYMGHLPSPTEDIFLLPVVAGIVGVTLGVKTPYKNIGLALVLAFISSPIVYSIGHKIFFKFTAYQYASVLLLVGALLFFLLSNRVNLNKTLEKFAMLGSISYALYLIHSPVILVLFPLVSNWHRSFLLFPILATGVVFGFSYILEHPFQSLVRSQFPTKSSSPALRPVVPISE
jgi:peptidoglycan/LPS O-acetylase OafA/YrhL